MAVKATKPPLQGPHLITRSELARRLGVSRPAVTQACRVGGSIHDACEGTVVNVRHASVKRWLARRDAATKDFEPPPVPPVVAAPPIAAGFNEVHELLAVLTEERPEPLQDLRDPVLVERWVRTHKLTEEAIKAKRLRERVERCLIPRTTVVNMLAHSDVAFRLLLSDAPRAIATRLAADDMTKAAALIRDILSQHLDVARERMATSLEADDPTAPLVEAAE